MPFVSAQHRESPDMKVAGDRCFVAYRRFKAMWKQEPRWTTVDKIASEFWPNPIKRAAMLAFMVFFAFVVLNYERLKLEQNGDIDG